MRHDEDALNRVSTMPSPEINAEVPSEYSVARQGSLLRWGRLPPYPRMECPPDTRLLVKSRSCVGGDCPHTPEWSALRILSRSPRLAPSLGATAPIPPLFIGCVGYAIVASRQSKSLSRGLCPYPPNRGAHYRYTLKMRLTETYNLSPLRKV